MQEEREGGRDKGEKCGCFAHALKAGRGVKTRGKKYDGNM